MKLDGNTSVTAVFDGATNIGYNLLHNINAAERDRMLSAQFVPQDKNGVQTSINAYLVRHNGQLSLIDAGMGESGKAKSLGHIVENLAAAGVKPKQINNVIITHLHPDHVGGITANGKAVFPNATVYVPQEDADFFLAEPTAQTPERLAQTQKTPPPPLRPTSRQAENFQKRRKSARH
ncbi:MBL fold metallo-hydrolase [Neisseria chenwenguii]|uniref:MBL fold metallo-hydrolase n=1 Tax=Neisseria chenwenguii TaxID=1853278 RepID=UPI000F4FB2F5|nr:MBL fold metallo-hydrolase [Neisseria chenwenguii]ROV54421.1 MBL fold metallo-hydrolase [Neisseria chenwenguii]